MTKTVVPPRFISLGGDAWAHANLEQLLVDADQIRPHPDNPRNGDQDAIDISITENKVYRPVIVQRSTGYVLAGNHTYFGMIGKGATKVPVVWLEVDDDEADSIMLADNHTADLGRYDDALLAKVLHRVTESERGLLATSYLQEDVDDILARITRAESQTLNAARGLNADGTEKSHGLSESGGKDGFTPSLQDDLAKRDSKGVRYLLLEYGNATYVEVIGALDSYRAEHDLESNADAVLHLLDLPIKRLSAAGAEQ